MFALDIPGTEAFNTIDKRTGKQGILWVWEKIELKAKKAFKELDLDRRSR